MTRTDWPRATLGILIVLFLLQGLRVLFSTMFGILYDQVFAGSPTIWLPVSLLLAVTALLSPAAVPGRVWAGGAGMAAAICAVARIAMTVNDADVRFVASLIVVGGALMAFTALLQSDRRLAYLAFVAALAVDQLLRIAGQTYDLTIRPDWLPMQVLLSSAVLGLALTIPQPTGADADKLGMSIAAGIGAGAVLFLETSLLSVGNAAARWGGVSYALMAPLLLAIALVWSIFRPRPSAAVTRVTALALTVLLPLFLMLAYHTGGALASVSLVAAALLALLGWAIAAGPSASRRRSGAALGMGMALFLGLNFLNAFAFTYAYTLPVLRGAGPAIYLAAGLLAALPAWRPRPPATERDRSGRPSWAALALGAGGLALSITLVWPRPALPAEDPTRLRLATYNIHYGYDGAWHFSPDAQAAAIRESGADVVTLQEVDTGRMTSYMVDDAYYLARSLGMNVAYLPTVEHLTGIAVLYRGTAVLTEGQLITSLQEQTGVVHVELDRGGRRLHAFGVWMGLEDEDTQTQIEEALAFVGDRTPASFGGDFNAQPGSPVYIAVKNADFLDPFPALGIVPAPDTSPAVNPQERIDFVWLRTLPPAQARVSESLASDHRLVVVEVDLSQPPTEVDS
jgi:endonuclease/exonuclease/phosphatase family metal-dependent hydrolase